MKEIEIKGSKIAELAYLHRELGTVEDKNVLIVGEREGSEGVSVYTLACIDNDTHLTLTDITDIEPDSYVGQLMSTRRKTKFIQSDFVNFEPYRKEGPYSKYDFIVCISVLEHFGMKFDGKNMFDDGYEAGEDDTIYWNHDLVGLKKMTELLKDDGKIIITVPAGRYMNCSPETGYPFLRYYTAERRQLIKKYLSDLGYELTNEMWARSSNFKDWVICTEAIMQHDSQYQMNSYTPNGLWNFCIQKIK